MVNDPNKLDRGLDDFLKSFDAKMD